VPGSARVVVVGQFARDVVLLIDAMPEPGSAAAVRRRRETLGGKGANQAVAFAQLGLPVALVAVSGDDRVADGLLDRAHQDGIDLTHVFRRPGVETALVVEAVDAEGRWRYLEDLPPETKLTVPDVEAAADALRTADAVVVQLQQPEPVPLTAARLARDVVTALPPGALLVLGSSTPVRDVDRLAVPRGDVTVLANRGVAGIDGTISTALGAALAHGGPAVALLGDLTFLHDLTGLLTGAGEARPDLTLVVPDNDGGGIFAQLEPGQDRFAAAYRRVFGTPHGRDLVAVARSLGWAASAVTEPAALAEALTAGGPRVVVVRTDQRAEAALAVRLREAAAEALALDR
jgi:hypothetical protein